MVLLLGGAVCPWIIYLKILGGRYLLYDAIKNWVAQSVTTFKNVNYGNNMVVQGRQVELNVLQRHYTVFMDV